MNTAQSIVIPPRMKKSISHRSGLKLAGSVEIPIEMYDPIIPPQPREEYQMHCRRGISFLV
jgi:hypothetical protein